MALADVDGDGDLDLLTSPGPGSTTQVRALDALTGLEIDSLLAFDPGFTGGAFLAAG